MSTLDDDRTKQLHEDAQRFVDDLSRDIGVELDDATASLLRRAYLTGRGDGVAWTKGLLPGA